MPTVPITLVGTVVSDPKPGYTRRGVPVTKFVLSTSAKVFEDGAPLDVDVTTWSVNSFDKLAVYAAQIAAVGQHVIVHGTAFESAWTTDDGEQRTTYEVRAEAIAPNSTNSVEPVKVTLIGAIVGTPELDDDEGVPVVDLSVRTARWRRVGDRHEAKDVTDWPVVASGRTAATIASQFHDGDNVVVYGEARGVPRKRADGRGEYQDLEVWAEAIGPDLKREAGRPA